MFSVIVAGFIHACIPIEKQLYPVIQEENELLIFSVRKHRLHVETYLSLECIVLLNKKGVTVFPVSMFVPEFVTFCGESSNLEWLCALRWAFGQCLISPLHCLCCTLLCVIVAEAKR